MTLMLLMNLGFAGGGAAAAASPKNMMMMGIGSYLLYILYSPKPIGQF